jgi:hypothetical protein
MDSEQLRCVVSCDHSLRYVVHGVYAYDEALEYIHSIDWNRAHYPIAMIVNTDRSNEAGRHWFCLFRANRRHCVNIFDSIGSISTQTYLSDLENHLSVSSSDQCVLVNKERLQSLTSNVCGQYVIYCLLRLCAGAAVNDVVNTFTNDDYRRNDIFVYEYIGRRFPYCIDKSRLNRNSKYHVSNIVQRSCCFP